MTRACHGPIRAAVGDAFTDEEIEDALARLAERHRRKRAENPAASDEAAWAEAMAEVSGDMLEENLAEARLKRMALSARARRRAHIDGMGLREDQALSAFLTGRESDDPNAGQSIDARTRALSHLWSGELMRDLKQAGLLARFTNPFASRDRGFERRTVKEMARLNGNDAVQPTGDADAVKAAEIFNRAIARARDAQNDRGAFIRPLPGYVARQTHDPIKIGGGFFRGLNDARRQAAKTEWVRYIRERLDDRSFEGVYTERARRRAAIAELKGESAEPVTRRRRPKMPDRGDEIDAPTETGGTERVTVRATYETTGELDGKAFTKKTIEVVNEAGEVRLLSFDDLPDRVSTVPPAKGKTIKQIDPDGLAGMDDAELEANWLGRIWTDIVSGRHETVQGAGDDLDGFKPPPGKARAVSRSRTLHFKSPDAWMDYNEKYGRGSLFEAVDGQMQRGAQNAELMKAFGPSPRASFEAEVERLAEQAKARGDAEAIKKLSLTGLVNHEFSQLDGSATAPESVRLAAFSRGVRVSQQLAKLGGMVLSALTDTALAASALSRAGVSYLDGYTGVYGSILKLNGEAREEVADMLNVASRVALGDITARHNALDGANGVMGRALSVFYKANLFTFWQNRIRRGAGAILARHLGRNAQKPFTALDVSTRTALERYGINEGLWNELRRHAGEVEDLGSFLTLDAARDADPRTLAAALGMKKPKDGWAQAQLREARDEAELRLQAYFVDQVDNAMTEPRARERARIRRGLKPGTGWGTAMELFMQFKTFPVTVITRQLGPALKGYGGRSPVAATAHLILASTALGFVAMQAKEIAKGRMPRPLRDEDGNVRPGVFLAAFLQGGGAGIYGDLLLADYNRFGGGVADTLGGPAVGELTSLARLLRATAEGDDAGAQAMRFAIGNTPFANLFYTRTALDYLLLYHMQEAVNPGSLRRYERRLQEERGVEFIVPPSEVVEG